jgi:hypothetical protein
VSKRQLRVKSTGLAHMKMHTRESHIWVMSTSTMPTAKWRKRCTSATRIQHCTTHARGSTRAHAAATCVCSSTAHRTYAVSPDLRHRRSNHRHPAPVYCKSKVLVKNENCKSGKKCTSKKLCEQHAISQGTLIQIRKETTHVRRICERTNPKSPATSSN